MIRLRCEMAVPSGLRRTRVPVRLEQVEPDSWVLSQARGFPDATHQLVDAAGVPLLTHLAEKDPGVGAELARSGFWELPETAAVVAAVRPGGRVLDVGAQVGYYAVLAARAARSGGRVYAFDPAPDNRTVLAANAALSALLCPEAAAVETFDVALSDRPGNVRLHLSDRNPGDHSTVPGVVDAVETRVVPVTTVDALRWAPEGRRVEGPVGVLKVDAAGSEPAILRGAERTLAEDRPVVVVTLRPAAVGPDPCVALIEWVAARGYTALRFVHPVAPEPYMLLSDAVRVLDPGDAAEHVRRKMVGPQVALVAYPDPR